LLFLVIKLYQTQNTVFTPPNSEKRVEKMRCCGVFLMNFEMFGNVIKHSFECLIYLHNRNLK